VWADKRNEIGRISRTALEKGLFHSILGCFMGNYQAQIKTQKSNRQTQMIQSTEDFPGLKAIFPVIT